MSRNGLFTDRFLEMAKAYPDHVAVLFEGKPAFTYDELAGRAQAIAFELLEHGAGPEHVVGLCLDKSADYISSLIGVWFAGAAFVPIDPALPRQRIDYMVSRSGMVLALSEDRALLPQQDMNVLIPHQIPARADSLSPAGISAEQLAYVIFTSGSSGQPKGVAVTHAGIVSFLDAQIEAFNLKPTSRSLFYLSTSFDASISDMGTALLSGACLCIERKESLQPGPGFARLLRDRRITHVDIPPSLLKILRAADMPGSLETVIIGGEPCPPAAVREWAGRFRVINVYGPTEATVCTSLCRCDAESWQRPLLGQPLPGVEYIVMDESGKQAAPGVAGELYIGGVCLARGYVGDDRLTNSKFIWRNGKRLYRTGDLVVHRADGEYEFCGRIDRQVKLRGVLIEPEEIESRLCELEEVVSAAVVKRPSVGSSGREILVAFLKGRTGATVDLVKVRTHLAQLLPHWMLPQRYEVVDELPTTATGKVDLAELRIRELSTGNRPAGREDRPSTATETVLQSVWQKVLGKDDIGLDDDFFDIGGDSFAVMEAIVSLEAMGLTVPPALFASHPTISAMAEGLDRLKTATKSLEELALGGVPASELRRDVELSGDWNVLLRSAEARDGAYPERPGYILLTGATGFLGSRLLDELLKRTQARIACLVRARSEREALERIEKALLLHGKELKGEDLERIEPTLGDLSSGRLGLADNSQWERLCDKVDTVYHLGAQVNMLATYARLRPANVEGTKEIARFLATGRRKWLHYASTLSVFVGTDKNTGVAVESDDLSGTAVIYGGYAQSKWAAEVFLRSLQGRAGPLSVFRLGLITGDSRTGAGSPDDFLTMFVRGIARLGCVPRASGDLCVDITPVDYAAAAMAELSLSGMGRGAPLTYHIANSRGLSVRDLVHCMAGVGLDIEEVDRHEFARRTALISTQKAPSYRCLPYPPGEASFTCHRLDLSESGGCLTSESSGDDPDVAQAAAFLALCRSLADATSFRRFRMMDLFQATGITFDQRNTEEGLRGAHLVCPTPDEELITTYLKRILSPGGVRAGFVER